MTGNVYRRIAAAMLTACALLFSVDSFAQLQLFSSPAGKGKAKSDKPTLINADAMDIDMANDRVTLLGNVDVEDPEMSIKCRKMIITLGKGDKPAASTGDASRDEHSGKQVVKIECIGDVVITRNQVEDEAGNKENQQAFAGKAVYLIKEDTITLTEDPVLVSGVNRLRGERIILHTKTERVMVFKGVARARTK